MDFLLPALTGIVAAGVAGLAAWLVNAGKIGRLNGRIVQLETEMMSLHGAAEERDIARKELADVREKLAHVEGKAETVAQRENELADARKQIFDLGRDRAELRAKLEHTETAHAEQVRQLTALRQEVQEQFKLLAGEALKASTEDFTKRANEIFESQKKLTAAEIDKRSQTISDLVKPLGQSLEKYEVFIKEIEKERVSTYGGLKTALEAVQQQQNEVRNVTSNLVMALKASPKTRGRWGEETLRRVMEMSGMVEHCDFETEKHFRGPDENLRPDVIINVAGGRKIVVDAKAPVTAYLESISAEDEEGRDLLLKRHASQLRERLTNLSTKSYWSHIDGSAECVVMFVPGDNFVAAAFERDPDLFEDAIKSRVLICTPTTFIALAKAISYGWRQESIEENALEVARLGKDLYTRLCKMGEHVATLGRQLKSSVDNYNRFLGSLEGSVLPQARKFKDLGVEGTSKPLPEPEPVDSLVRIPQADRDLLLTSDVE